MEDFGTLIKLGRCEHIRELREQGLLYMNRLPYFWEIEDQDLRGDPFDSIAEVRRGQKVTLTLPDGNEASMEGRWTWRIPPSEPEKINIFCMYALRPLAPGSFPLDDRNFRFGEYALVLINRSEFMRRIESTLKTQGINRYEAAIVDYVDNEYIGELGPFRKFQTFAYQYEWRLVCYGGTGTARKICVGNIDDISVIVRSDELNRQLNVKVY